MHILGIGRDGLREGFASLLTADDVGQIHEAALRFLTWMGIIVRHESVLTLLAKAGCGILRTKRGAYIPAPLAARSVAQATREAYLYTRRREQAMALRSGPLHVRTSSGASARVKLESGQRRVPPGQDAADAAGLADSMPHVQGVSTMTVQPSDLLSR